MASADPAFMRAVLQSSEDVTHLRSFGRPMLRRPFRFAQQVNRCATPEEVIKRLHTVVTPSANAFGIWRVPRSARLGKVERFPQHYVHPEAPSGFMEEFWLLFRKHGPSFLARYAWQTRRDVTLSEAIRILKPKPQELWIAQLCQRHGMRELMYVPIVDWWFVLYWWPKRPRLSEDTRQALRFAADAAGRRVEELVGRQDLKEDPKLTGRERATLRLLKDDLSVAQVARWLNVRPSTVKQYVARSKRKLGTSSLRDTISEAVRYYGIL
jgi:DNA-binding CsgD family transcriptional regulator